MCNLINTHTHGTRKKRAQESAGSVHVDRGYLEIEREAQGVKSRESMSPLSRSMRGYHNNYH